MNKTFTVTFDKDKVANMSFISSLAIKYIKENGKRLSSNPEFMKEFDKASTLLDEIGAGIHKIGACTDPTCPLSKP